MADNANLQSPALNISAGGPPNLLKPAPTPTPSPTPDNKPHDPSGLGTDPISAKDLNKQNNEMLAQLAQLQKQADEKWKSGLEPMARVLDELLFLILKFVFNTAPAKMFDAIQQLSVLIRETATSEGTKTAFMQFGERLGMRAEDFLSGFDADVVRSNDLKRAELDKAVASAQQAQAVNTLQDDLQAAPHIAGRSASPVPPTPAPQPTPPNPNVPPAPPAPSPLVVDVNANPNPNGPQP